MAACASVTGNPTFILSFISSGAPEFTEPRTRETPSRAGAQAAMTEFLSRLRITLSRIHLTQ